MGELYNNFEEELQLLHENYGHRPRKELLKLLLLALEREELVTVSYREELMKHRLEELNVPDDLKSIFRQCLIWTWLDEEMHARFTRGLLVQIGGFITRLQSRMKQVAGRVGGWASSVQQHLEWRQAPLSRSLATVISCIGTAAGKVPEEVREELRYLSFRTFCSVQIDAERTASAAWQRMVEIADDYPGIDERTRSQFRKMWKDEERHRQVFDLINQSLDDQGHLREEVTVESVANRLRELGPYFLPREHREEERQLPLGEGGTVAVHKKEPPEGKEEALETVLRLADFFSIVQDEIERGESPVDEQTAVIKANFKLGYHREDTSMITDPGLVSLLAKHLQEMGFGRVFVGETPGIYREFLENRSVEYVGEYFGYESPHYELVDLSEHLVEYDYPQGMAQHSMSEIWRDADVRIVFSKMRSHPIDFAHLCLGGTQEIGDPVEEYLFPERLANRITALFMPISECPPHFSLIDAYESAADGLVGCVGCPDAPSPGRLYAGRDALSLDMVAVQHMGLDDPREVELFHTACHWFGDPSSNITVKGIDQKLTNWRHPYSGEFQTLLSLVAGPVYEYSSNRGELFLPPADTDAFPRKSQPGYLMSMQQWFVRKLLGLKKLS